MKITTYKCDNDECGNETNNIKIDGWLEIGSEDNTLFINNHLKNKKLISLARYKGIHFCSSKCFINFFIDTTT